MERFVKIKKFANCRENCVDLYYDLNVIYYFTNITFLKI